MGSGPPQKLLTRADFDVAPVEVLQKGAAHAPDVLLYDIAGERIVLKDFRDKPWMWRTFLGRLLTAREARVLRALGGMANVPQFRGRPDRWSVAMTYVPGRRATSVVEDTGHNDAYFAELEAMVAEMHRRGVVHMDMKHRTNLAATTDGRPVLLDFASGLCFNPRRLIGRLLLRMFAVPDRIALLKWRRKLSSGGVSEADACKLRRLRLIGRCMRPVKALGRLRRRRARARRDKQ